MKKATLVFFAALFLVPVPSFASVRVNEIAWMGTAVSSSKEWIELFNDGDSSVDLSGHVLFAEGVGKLSIPLTGTIASKSFFLLERTSDDTVSGISADQIYAGALGNSGEILILKDAAGGEVQRINASEGWQAGNNTTKETMQWNNGAWITAAATPKAENASVASTPPAESDETNTPSPKPSSLSPETSAHGSPVPLSEITEEPALSVSAGRDRIVPAGGTLRFEAHAFDEKGKRAENTMFSWSFGDGFLENGAKVSHIYEYPGNYIVILNGDDRGTHAVARANVRVFALDILLSLREENVASLANRSSYEINVGGWKLKKGGGTFVFPEDTIIGSKEEVYFSPAATEFSTGNTAGIELFSPNGKIAARAVTVIAQEQTASEPAPADTLRENMQTALLRAAADAENIRAALSTATAAAKSDAGETKKPARNIASYQYAAAADPMKEEKGTASSSNEPAAPEQPHVIALPKPQGFFAKLWHFFF